MAKIKKFDICETPLDNLPLPSGDVEKKYFCTFFGTHKNSFRVWVVKRSKILCSLQCLKVPKGIILILHFKSIYFGW